nr:glycosyltransferase [Pedobacter kyonggii]
MYNFVRIINKNTNIFHFNSNFHHELAKLAKKNNFKTVYTQHSSLWKNFYKNNFQNFSDNWNILENENRDRYSETLKKEKELCKDSDKVICLTDDSLDFTNDFYDIEKKKISLIYNGIDIDHVDITSNERKLLRLHYGFSADQILITYTGRIVKDKGISDLINAFKILIKKNPLVHLLLAGDGEIKHFSSNCTEINTHVTFTGFLNKEQLRDLYLISDIGVMPSLNEQTSYSVLEMMLYKLPVVISDIPGFKLPYINRKHVLKAKTVKTDQGILINNENLACCIEELTQDSALRNSLIENGFKLLKNKLNSNKMASKVIRIYQKLTYN